MLLMFFEHHNDFKWKNSKLKSCRPRRDQQFSYKNYLHSMPQKIYDFSKIYINHIKSYLLLKINKNNFYIKIIDLNEIYKFLVSSFFI
jgi:hypothetical protein